MAITKKKKEEIIAKVEGLAKDAKTLVFANFKGLSVAVQSEMRRVLRTHGISYTVAKKTLLKRALGPAYEGEMPALGGETALVSGADELAPAREFAVFVKKYPEQLSFVGGMFGGKFVSADEIKSIAAIPPLEALRAQFVQLINSPRQRFAVVLSAKADKGE